MWMKFPIVGMMERGNGGNEKQDRLYFSMCTCDTLYVFVLIQIIINIVMNL